MRPKIREFHRGGTSRVRLSQLKGSIAANIAEAWEASRRGSNWDQPTDLGFGRKGPRVFPFEYDMTYGATWVELGSRVAFQVLAGDDGAWLYLEAERRQSAEDANDSVFWEQNLAKTVELVEDAQALLSRKFGVWGIG